MDFGSWSPAHTILVLFVFIGFVGQGAVYFHRTAQNDKKIDKQGEMFFHALERLEERMDKRFVELANTMNQGFSDIRSEMNQRFSDMQVEIRDVRLELSKLNQNHIDHLNQHHSD